MLVCMTRTGDTTMGYVNSGRDRGSVMELEYEAHIYSVDNWEESWL